MECASSQHHLGVASSWGGVGVGLAYEPRQRARHLPSQAIKWPDEQKMQV